MDQTIVNRKKVYIICGYGEYKYLWEHLHEIIDVQKEELIIPYFFMEYDKIDQTITSITNELAPDSPASYDDVKEAITEYFLEEKNRYFRTYVQDAEEIIVLLPEHATCHPEDINEKNQEIEFCGTKELKNKKFRTVNLLTKEKQKVIKP